MAVSESLQYTGLEKGQKNTPERYGYSSEFKLSKALRPKKQPVIYASGDIMAPNEPLFLLAEGQLKLGAPPEYDEFIDSDEYSEAHKRAGKEYLNLTIDKGIQHVLDRFDLTDEKLDESDVKPFVAFSEGGSDRILKELALLFSSQGKTNAIFIGPCFPNIVNFAKLTQDKTTSQGKARIGEAVAPLNIPVASNIDRLMNRDVQKNIPRDKVFYVCNPVTPTGEVIPPGKIEEFAKYCAETGNTLIIDEAFADVLPDNESAIALTKKYPNLVVTRSLSKVVGIPGERIGYTVMSANEGEKYADINKVEAYNIGGPKKVLINKIMDKKILIPHLDRVRRESTLIKSKLVEQLQEAGISYIKSTDPRVPIITLKGENERFYAELRAKGVDVVNGNDFRNTHPELTSQYVRMTIPQGIDDIPHLVELIKEVIEGSIEESQLAINKLPAVRTRRKPGRKTN